MSASRLNVNIGYLEAICLKGIGACITDLEIVRRGDGSKYLVLHVEGPDVPDSPHVVAITSQSTKLEPVP